MPTPDPTCRAILADVRRHLVPIAVSVLISVAVCRLHVIAVLICFGIGGALVMWLTGWRLKLVLYPRNQHPKEDSSHDQDHTSAS